MARDEFFEFFIEEVGEATFHQAVPEKSIEKYRGVLPDQLLTYWQEEGWNGYIDGLFWTVNPDDYACLLDQWLEDTPIAGLDQFHVIARTAFGKLYVIGEKYSQSLIVSCPNNAIITKIEKLTEKNDSPDKSISFFFASKKKQSFDITDKNEKPMFDRALKKLGPLKSDEMYGFEPALVAGGSELISNLQKVKTLHHLSILRAFDQPFIPEF